MARYGIRVWLYESLEKSDRRCTALPVERDERDGARLGGLDGNALDNERRRHDVDAGARDIAVARGHELADRTIVIAVRRLTLGWCFGGIGKPEESLLLFVDPEMEVRRGKLRLRKKGERQGKCQGGPHPEARFPSPKTCRTAFHHITLADLPCDASHRHMLYATLMPGWSTAKHLICPVNALLVTRT